MFAMEIQGAVALVTGANRGMGAAFAQSLLDRGAAKVYAGARDISAITDPRLTPLELDVTSPASIAAAAARAQDVTIVVNNAGVGGAEPILGSEETLRHLLDVNLFGLVAVSRAFAPLLAANGGGALVNMLSDASWRQARLGAYAVSKAAAWAATNSTRVDLAPQGTLVIGVHAGFLDTDLTAGFDVPKLDPRIVAEATMDGIEENAYEVYGNENTRAIKSRLSGPIEEMYAEFLPARASS
jgi:NAD(P)-dependent dehydrogenase (short-subunit alcohol dehydrogenase family)